MHAAAISIPLRAGAAAAIVELLKKDPPLSLAEPSINRLVALAGGGRLVLLLEGVHAEELVQRLLGDGAGSINASQLAPYLTGQPTLVTPFVWEQQTFFGGASWGALPGPGNSEGGFGDF